MIHHEASGPVSTLTLDAPEVRNAFDADMITGLTAGIAAAEADPSCRCLVVTGAGGTFCAGRNLSGPSGAGDLAASLDREGAWEDVFQALHRMSKPSVAVVAGHAVAGGFTLAMGCDFVLADEAAVFGAFEMRNGFSAAVNTPLLAKLVPPRMALEWAMFGEPIPARRLYELGLVNRLAAGVDELADLAREFTAHLANLDSEAVAMTKELHRSARNMPLADALAMGKQQNALIAASGRLDQAMEQFRANRR